MAEGFLAKYRDGTVADRSIPEAELLERLTSGEATLDDRQVQPPTFLLDIFDGRLNNLEILGAEIADAQSLKKVADGLEGASGLRYSVDGVPVSWVHPKKRLIDAIGDFFGKFGDGEWNVWRDANRIIGEYLKLNHRRVLERGKVLEADRKARRLIPLGRVSPFNSLVEFVELPQAWFEFVDRRNSLRARLTDIEYDGLRAGRIICCEESASGARVLPPSYFAGKVRLGREHYFCFARDLPAQWFDTAGRRRLRAKHAAEWMLRTFIEVEKSGRYALISDLMAIAEVRNRVKEDALRKAWRAIEGKPSLGGNVAHHLKLTKREIEEKY